jgi:hypothetical protein
LPAQNRRPGPGGSFNSLWRLDGRRSPSYGPGATWDSGGWSCRSTVRSRRALVRPCRIGPDIGN